MDCRGPYSYFGAMRMPPSIRTVSPFIYECETRKNASLPDTASDLVKVFGRSVETATRENIDRGGPG